MRTLINATTNVATVTGGGNSILLPASTAIHWEVGAIPLTVVTPDLTAGGITNEVISIDYSTYVVADGINVNQSKADAFMAGLPYGVALSMGLLLFLLVRKAWTMGDHFGD